MEEAIAAIATAPAQTASSDLSGPTISNIIFGILALLVNLLVLLSTTSYKSWSLYANKHFSKVSPSEIVGCFIVSAFASLLEVILFLCPQSSDNFFCQLNQFLDSFNQILFFYCHFLSIFGDFIENNSNGDGVESSSRQTNGNAKIWRNCVVKVLVLLGIVGMCVLKIIIWTGYAVNVERINSIHSAIGVMILTLLIASCVAFQIGICLCRKQRQDEMDQLLPSSAPPPTATITRSNFICSVVFNLLPIVFYLPSLICELILLLSNNQLDGVKLCIKVMVFFNDIIHPLFFLWINNKGFAATWLSRFIKMCNSVYQLFIQAINIHRVLVAQLEVELREMRVPPLNTRITAYFTPSHYV